VEDLLSRRLLIYSQDGLGLGHLRRSTNIAREVLRREPEANVLVVADSPAAPYFLPPQGVDYVKLPTIVKTGDSSWRPSTLSMPLADIMRLRSTILTQTFREYQPDIVLVDHMPVGALGELKPLLDQAVEDVRHPRLFAGLRDVLDRPEVIRAVWTETGAYDYLKAYEAVLIYGSGDIMDASAEYGLTPYARRVVNCNFVATEAGTPPAEEPADDPLILVMGGGGADLYPIAKAFLAALPILLAETRLRVAVMPGPFMPAEQVDALTEMANGQPAEVLRGFEDATSWLSRASAVVMMAGYNSICEVMSYRKKALVIPRAGPSAEQRIRSRLFAERGLVHVLDPDELTAPRLAAAVISLLADDSVPNRANIPALDGASRAADVLLDGT
jgi:predicted glycosyltransferase